MQKETNMQKGSSEMVFTEGFKGQPNQILRTTQLFFS